MVALWPFDRRARLRRQASDWIARLNGPHDEADLARFERWYRAHPDHAAAYDRLARIFDVARGLEPASVARSTDVASPSARVRHLGYGLAAVAGLLAVLALGSLGLRDLRQQTQIAETLRSDVKAPRHVRLADGSQVWLAAGSELEVALGPSERRLRLRRGEGTFSVAHERRPFVVVAGDTEVLARGTKFSVRLGEAMATIALIEGRVEVSYPKASQAPGRRTVVLEPGRSLTVPTGQAASGQPARGAENGQRAAMIEFDDTRLADAAARLTARSGRQLRLADRTLGDLRVTGAYREADVDGFARAVAEALELEVRRGPDGTLWLSPLERD